MNDGDKFELSKVSTSAPQAWLELQPSSSYGLGCRAQTHPSSHSFTSLLDIYINLPCSRKTHHQVALIHFHFFASTPIRNKTFFFLKNDKERSLDKLSPNNFFIRHNVTAIHPAILLHSCPMHKWLASMGVNHKRPCLQKYRRSNTYE